MTRKLPGDVDEPAASSFPIARKASFPTFRRGSTSRPAGARSALDLVCAVAIVLGRHNDNRPVRLGIGPASASAAHAPAPSVTFGPDAGESVRQFQSRTSVLLDRLPGGPSVVGSVLVGEQLPGAAAQSAEGVFRLEQGQVVFDYSTDHFDHVTAESLLDQVTLVSDAAESRSGLPLRDLDFVPVRERIKIIARDSRPAAGELADPWDLLRQCGQQAAERLAVTDEAGSLTYRELIGQVQRTVDGMLAAGVGTGDIVTVPVAPDRWSVVAMLAALNLGACYVPVDPQSPEERRRMILGQVRPRAALVAEGGGVATRVHTEFVGLTGTAPGGIGSESAERPAYVLFTSGSTGRPKGVAISRRSLASLLKATEPVVDRHHAETWISLHSFAFDASVWEIYGSLCYGGTLVIASQAERRDPDRVVEAMARHGVHSLTISPTAFEGFKRASRLRPDVVSALRRIILCAEPLSVPSVDDWFDQWGEESPAVLNMYGITEVTVHSTVERLRRSVGEQRIRIGTGLPDTPIYVVDDRGWLVPDGVAGELLVGGEGVALGYVGPDRRSLDERFVPDRFSQPPGGRLYRSGDIGRRLGDGTLEYLGRRDRQLKIRGHRIEAGEIEAAAGRLNGVSAARAWAQPGEDGSVRLCLAMAADATVTSEVVTAHLESLLPEYMNPAVVVVVDELPVTFNGKLDTETLLCRHGADVARGTAAVTSPPPADPRELKVADIMGLVLGLGRLPPEANFFQIGGDSISAIRLVAALNDAGLAVTLTEIYRRRTVAGIAASAVESPPRQVGNVAAPVAWLPATVLQRGMIYHNLLEGARFYHDLLYYRLDRLPDATLRSALDSITARHPVLRSCFVSSPDGELKQQIVPEAQLELRWHDARQTSDVSGHLRAWAQDERDRGFDLAVPGLMRVAVHQVDDDACVLSVSVHHAILDGWSAATFVTELLTAWTDGRPAALSHQRDEESVLAEYGRLVEQSRRDPGHRMFWERRLAALGPPVLDRAAGTGEPARAARVAIDASVCQSLDRYAAELGVSQRSVFLAVHCAAAVASSSRPTVPTTGLVTGGRPEVIGGTEVLGLFLNTLPVGLEVGGLSWRQAIARVFDAETEMAPFRRFPLADIQAMAARPLIDIAFNYTHFRSYHQLESRGLVMKEAWYDEQTEFPVLVTVNRSVRDDGAELVVVARPGVDPGFEHRYADAFATLTASLSLDADVDISGHGRPSSRDTAVSAEMNGARWPIEWDELLNAIRGHARRRPHAVAIVDGNERRTYAELWADASRVSAQLARQQVEARSRVFIEGERSIAMIAALLATWMRGACAVPVDAALPPRRRELLSAMARPTARLAAAGAEVTVAAGQLNAEPAPGLVRIDPGSPAYLLFTSGTTGVPKGVMMPFEGLANLVAWQARRFGPAGPGRVALFATVGFDVSLQETLACLVGGGTLVVVRPEVKVDPVATLALLRDQAVDVLFTPPLILRQLARASETGASTPRLSWVICAGEALIVDESLRRFGAASGFRLVNQYGPTETHVVTEADLGADPEDWPDLPGIGMPIDNVDVRCVGAAHLGGAGELLVTGQAVALGYLDPDRGTAEISGGFSVTSATRSYRTGDLARLGPRGIEFHGRADSQLKIRGYRVDVVEIEQTLRSMDAVADCVVQIQKDARDASLRAMVQPNPGTAIDEHAVRSYLAERLPAHAVPAYVELVSLLAADSRGKADRSATPERPVRRRSSAGHSPLERALLTAWSDVLGQPQMATDEAFFDAGGSSLLLLDLFLRLRSEVSVPFEISHLLQYPTIASFAGFVRSQENAEGACVVNAPTVS